MEMPLRVPVPPSQTTTAPSPSQCYPSSSLSASATSASASASDYVLDSCHGNMSVAVAAASGTIRQPLGESTGNAQLGISSSSSAGYVSRHHHPQQHQQHQQHHHRPGPLGTSMSSMALTPPILTPPIVPTQSLGLQYRGAKGYGHGQGHQYTHHHVGRRRVDINPIWLYWQQFQTYRKKQDDKDDKVDQKWPQVLEDAFLDALLIIPHIGRKKFVVHQMQYGRNMLLGEYLSLAYCASLPPGVEPDPKLFRGRKQVSSHIQVLKNIFKNHRCCHIFLPKEVKKSKNAEEGELVSLKRHPVLVALSEGRLPDERPNYEYFARILALNNQIVVRPKRCWIFVSHQDVVVHDDGSGSMASTGERLSRDNYPHLERNLDRDKWPKEEQHIFKSTMLHEFTKEFVQVESSALRDLSKEWTKPFPELHSKLEALMAANAQKDILTMESQMDIIHMQVTLELNEKRRFPAQSELNSWVEINIEKPQLLNHRWRVDTKLVRPAELSYASSRSSPQLVYDTSAEIAIQYQHRPECDGPRGGVDICRCMSQQNRRDWVTVPFPADVWALTLSNCAEYPAHPFSSMARRQAKARTMPRGKTEGADDGQSDEQQQPTQMDLVPQIAMMQEIWSCPPEDYRGIDAKSRASKRWTRRAMILWTFKTLHSMDPNGKLVTAENGRTSWRFLTVLDPVSEYHLQNSLVGGSRSNTPSVYGDAVGPAMAISTSLPPSARDVIMSPSPTYQQHLTASMSENFSAAWDAADGINMSSAAVQAYDAHLMAQAAASAPPASYSMLSGYGSHAGLSTPPPSACLASSFSHSFDAPSGPDHVSVSGYMANPVTAAAIISGPHVLSDTIPSVAHYGASSTSYQVDLSPYGSAWDGSGVSNLDSHTWQTGYATTPGTNNSMPWADADGVHHNHGHGHGHGHHGHHDPSSHWAPAASTTAATVTASSWTPTPATAASTPHTHTHSQPHTWASTSASASTTDTATDEDHDISHEWEEVDISSMSASVSASASVTASDLSQGESQVQPQMIPVPLPVPLPVPVPVAGHGHGHDSVPGGVGEMDIFNGHDGGCDVLEKALTQAQSRAQILKSQGLGLSTYRKRRREESLEGEENFEGRAAKR